MTILAELSISWLLQIHHYTNRKRFWFADMLKSDTTGENTKMLAVLGNQIFVKKHDSPLQIPL